MPNLSGRLASIIVAACLLTGCQPPAPPPSPLPSYRCTPEAGGAEFDCSQKQYDDMVAKDKLYAEAEAVYRKFLAEDIRIAREGGVAEPTEQLLATATGAFLDDVMAGYRDDEAQGITIRGGDRIVKSLARLVGVAKAGSSVALRVCVDSSSVEVFRAEQRVGSGLITSDDLYFGRADGALKILGADGKEVKSCGS
jgi:hypothetical protein